MNTAIVNAVKDYKISSIAVESLNEAESQYNEIYESITERLSNEVIDFSETHTSDEVFVKYFVSNDVLTKTRDIRKSMVGTPMLENCETRANLNAIIDFHSFLEKSLSNYFTPSK